jgi:hypothetical protein
MTMRQQAIAMWPPARHRTARSSLVRRLIAAREDVAKQRVRAWLAAIDDDRLMGFGLTPEDIAVLRDGHRSPDVGSGSTQR